MGLCNKTKLSVALSFSKGRLC